MTKQIKQLSVGLTIILFVGLIVFFVFAFSGQLILPQGFLLGPIHLKYYGILMALGAWLGYLVAKQRAPRFDLPANLIDRLFTPAVIFGFIGARVYHVLSSYAYYLQQPQEILQVWHGGLGSYGALAGVIILLWIYSRWIIKPKTSLLTLLDWLVPSAIILQIFVRLGNFLNYELYGYPTSLPWKMFIPDTFRIGPYQNELFFHPLFLYEIVLLVFLFTFIRLIARKPFRPGILFFCYILLYNVGRFLLEFLRIESVFIGSLRQNAVVSALLAILALAWLIYDRYRDSKISQNS